jgi:hypothetical protein
MIEGSGSGSIPLTNRSGSMRPQNTWIRIRIRNTVRYNSPFLAGTVQHCTQPTLQQVQPCVRPDLQQFSLPSRYNTVSDPPYNRYSAVSDPRYNCPLLAGTIQHCVRPSLQLSLPSRYRTSPYPSRFTSEAARVGNLENPRLKGQCHEFIDFRFFS